MALIVALAAPLLLLVFLPHSAVPIRLARLRYQHSSVLPTGYAKNSKDDVDTKSRVSGITYMYTHVHTRCAGIKTCLCFQIFKYLVSVEVLT